ncbi:AAA-like domain-containing protein [Capilliphycus salinus ALCB114379]|uniref:AAA-like domain-containing protein n=1 Tax=Capilliphycus salinus TaxID=2768948 RepID=UPI0039A7092D
MEQPGGPIPAFSTVYIERPPLEKQAKEAIEQPGCLLRIKGSRKMGKTSLILQLKTHAIGLGYRVVHLDFRRVDSSILTDLNSFLRWLCKSLTYQLKLEDELDDYWDEDIGGKISCTSYLYDSILERLETPLILVLCEIDRLFEHQQIYQDFLPLLRSWYEEAKQEETAQKLRLVLTHSTEIYVPLKINQSPFNVGFVLKLPPLNLEQTQALVRCYGFSSRLTETLAKQLYEWVNGHPYLTQLALHHLAKEIEANPDNPEDKLAHILEESATPSGIYSDHLRGCLAYLQQSRELATAFKYVVEIDDPILLDPILTYQLESLGLVKTISNQVVCSCKLYREYFKNYELDIQNQHPLTNYLRALRSENQTLKQLSETDELTGLANRRWFNRTIQEEWQRLGNQGKFISLILVDIDHFKLYNDLYGHPAGDVCLQKVAKTLEECVNGSTDLVCRYGGEEFAILLPRSNNQSAMQVAQRIQEQIKALKINVENPKVICFPENILTVSIGVATIIPSPQFNWLELIEAADQALYKSKKTGRNRITVSEAFNSLNE